MERCRWLILAIILAITICFITCSCGRRELKIKHKDYNAIYNHELTTTIVHYASVVYLSDLMELFTWTCSRCDGVTEGFEVIDLIVDVQHCLQSYVGVAKNLNAIIIAFRGTQERSIQNWIEDLYWKQLDGNYPGMPDAMVHHGFYSAYHNTTIRPGILRAIKKAKKYYGDLDIIVTGHSMGGAMASFCGLDLVVWLYNIGFGSLVYPVEKVCDNLGEDPTCSRSVSGNSISDHLVYYGVEMGGDASQACRIVMDPVLGEFRRTDHKGNFVLSKNPASPLLKLQTRPDVGSTTL